MDGFLQVVDTLAWPFTVVLLILLLRNDIRRALRRLTHLKYREFEATFAADLREAERVGQALKVPKPKSTEGDVREGKTYGQIQEDLVRLAEISARAAIVEGWRYIDLAIRSAGRVLGMELRPGVAGKVLIEHLVEQHALSEPSLDLFHRLRGLRNTAIHADELWIEPDQVERYIDLALRFAADVEDGADAVKTKRSQGKPE